MDLTVYRDSAEIGTLRCGINGKTLCFDGTYELPDGIYRLYVFCVDGEILPLGVLLPEAGGLAIHRKLRRRDAETLVQRLQQAVLCPGDSPPQLPSPAEDEKKPPTADEEPSPDPDEDPAETALPEPTETDCARLDRWLETAHPEQLTEDPVLRRTLRDAPGALYRYHLGCIELALPEAAHAHLAPAMTIVRAEEIRGAHCFVLTFGPDGLPRPADASSID